MNRTLAISAAGAVSAVLCWFSVPVNAGAIYKWVASDGVTHYSETPPDAALASVEVIALDRAQDAPQRPVSDYRSVLEVANSIEASRLERERMRLEKRRLHRERQAQSPQPDYGSPVRFYYPPSYPLFHGPRPPGHRPFFTKPFLKPVPGLHPRPGRPTPAPRQPRNSLAHIKP